MSNVQLKSRTNRHATNLVQCVEHHLGPLDTWPTHILMYLFNMVPISPRVKRVAAFFYGNNVPLNIAVAFFHASNSASSIFVGEEMCFWYHIWQSALEGSRLCYYYNVKMKLILYINGKDKPQFEQVHELSPDISTGFEDTGCERYARLKLIGIAQAFPHVYRLTSHSH